MFLIPYPLFPYPSINNMLKKLTKLILDTLFPIECVSCGKTGFFICDNCFSKIEINKVETFQNECISAVHVASSYHQKVLQNLIHFFKYQFIESIGNDLSKIIIKYYLQIEIKLENPIIIPVPLHKNRLMERCFNQSEVLAKNFCNYFKYEIQKDIVARKLNTKHQADLKKEDRIKNIHNAFYIQNQEVIKNRNILIIDDVYTTGSTVLEIAKLLRSYGANEICCLVIAKN